VRGFQDAECLFAGADDVDTCRAFAQQHVFDIEREDHVPLDDEQRESFGQRRHR
jgi:hypothetical protein